MRELVTFLCAFVFIIGCETTTSVSRRIQYSKTEFIESNKNDGSFDYYVTSDTCFISIINGTFNAEIYEDLIASNKIDYKLNEPSSSGKNLNGLTLHAYLIYEDQNCRANPVDGCDNNSNSNFNTLNDKDLDQVRKDKVLAFVISGNKSDNELVDGTAALQITFNNLAFSGNIYTDFIGYSYIFKLSFFDKSSFRFTTNLANGNDLVFYENQTFIGTIQNKITVLLTNGTFNGYANSDIYKDAVNGIPKIVLTNPKNSLPILPEGLSLRTILSSDKTTLDLYLDGTAVDNSKRIDTFTIKFNDEALRYLKSNQITNNPQNLYINFN